MGWEVLIIPMIGVAVWIISTLIRNAEEAKAPPRPPQRRPERVTDLDRFVREAQRRRRVEEAEEEDRPSPGQREEEKPTRRERREPPRRTPPRRDEAPVARPVETTPAFEPVAAVPVVVV